MKPDELLDEILMIIREIKDNKEELEKVLHFLHQEITIPEEEEIIQLPEKFNTVIGEIAGSIDAGLVCYLNPDTLELDEIPNELLFDSVEYEEITGESMDEWESKHQKWQKCITIEPLDSNESFQIMEKFTDQLEVSKLKTQLINALNNRKPFAHFKRIIDDSDSRDDWFSFKNLYLKNHVKILIYNEIESDTSKP